MLNGSASAPAEPPVNHSARAKKSIRMNCEASVAIARYRPFSRAAGMPTIMPIAVVIRPASGMQKKTGMPNRLFSQADENAPKPKKALRSEARRDGKEGVGTCRFRGAADN